MKIENDIAFVLIRMVELLRQSEQAQWADALARIQQNQEDCNAVRNAILALFGGAGSLNDVVLSKDVRPLVQENAEFDQLRSKLYELCHPHDGVAAQPVNNAAAVR